MNFSEILDFAKRKNILKKDLAEAVGMTANGLEYAIKEQTLKVITLEMLSEKLSISPCYWWREDKAMVEDPEAGYSLKNSPIFAMNMDYREAKKQWDEEKAFLKGQISFLQNVINNGLNLKSQ